MRKHCNPLHTKANLIILLFKHSEHLLKNCFEQALSV